MRYFEAYFSAAARDADAALATVMERWRGRTRASLRRRPDKTASDDADGRIRNFESSTNHPPTSTAVHAASFVTCTRQISETRHDVARTARQLPVRSASVSTRCGIFAHACPVTKLRAAARRPPRNARVRARIGRHCRGSRPRADAIHYTVLRACRRAAARR